MRIATLYDIHGNLPALEAVLSEVADSGADRVVVGGDVMPGPMPSACLDLLKALEIPVDFIHGNGEREVLATLRGEPSTSLPESVQTAIKWTGEHLSPTQREFIAMWPSHARAHAEGLDAVFFCHATPENDTDIFTKDTPDRVLMPLFEDLNVELAVCGHTHMQFDRTVGEVRLVNSGSVGMPFGDAGAHWALLGPDVEFRRTEYDLEAAADRIRRSDYPGAEAFADHNVLDRPSEEDMLAAFNQRGLS